MARSPCASSGRAGRSVSRPSSACPTSTATAPPRGSDRAVCIGPARATESYLRPETIAQAALGTGCDAIHPGYGFLSENPRLSALARDEGIAFVGPPPEVIALAGDKLRARATAAEAGVPLVPGGAVAPVTTAAARPSEPAPPTLFD